MASTQVCPHFFKQLRYFGIFCPGIGGGDFVKKVLFNLRCDNGALPGDGECQRLAVKAVVAEQFLQQLVSLFPDDHRSILIGMIRSEIYNHALPGDCNQLGLPLLQQVAVQHILPAIVLPEPCLGLVEITNQVQAVKIGKVRKICQIAFPFLRFDFQRAVADQTQHLQRILDLGFDVFMQLVGDIDQILLGASA